MRYCGLQPIVPNSPIQGRRIFGTSLARARAFVRCDRRRDEQAARGAVACSHAPASDYATEEQLSFVLIRHGESVRNFIDQ